MIKGGKAAINPTYTGTVGHVFPGSRVHRCGVWNRSGAIDHPALGRSRHWRVRPALGSVRDGRGPFVARRRAYIKVKGAWMFLYSAVDERVRTVASYLSRTRDQTAARDFFRQALKRHSCNI